MKRPFSWKAVIILSILFVFGNLAAVPMLQASGQPTGTLNQWVLFSILNFIIAAISMYLAIRTGLGSPFFEGILNKGEFFPQLKKVLTVTLLAAVISVVPLLLLNLILGTGRIPAVWKMVLASVDAGVQEEIFYRFFIMTLLVWIGSFLKRDPDERPAEWVIWASIILSGIIFGWAHIDQQITGQQISGDALLVLIVNICYGIVLGWLYWKLGLESAILAHFFIDALGCSIVWVYYFGSFPLQSAVFLMLVLTAVLCLRNLRTK